MNWLDILLLAVVALSFIAGLLKGLVREVVSLAGVVLGIFAAIALAPAVSPVLARWISSEGGAYAAAMLLIFIVVMIVVEGLARLLSGLVKAAQLRPVDHVLGGAFGLVRGVLVGVMLILGITLFLDPGHPVLTGSRVAPVLGHGARLFSGILPDAMRDGLREKLDRIDAARGETETI